MPSSLRAAWVFHLAMNEPLPPLRGTFPKSDHRILFDYKSFHIVNHNAALSDGIGGALWLP